MNRMKKTNAYEVVLHALTRGKGGSTEELTVMVYSAENRFTDMGYVTVDYSDEDGNASIKAGLSDNTDFFDPALFASLTMHAIYTALNDSDFEYIGDLLENEKVTFEATT